MTAFSVSQVRDQHRKFRLGNWNAGGDITHYSYLRTPEFMPHAWVHRAGPISELKREPVRSIENISATTSLGKNTITAYIEFAPIDGWLVLHKGKIVFERYPAMRPYDKHIWWSCTQSIAGTIIGILEDRGQIDVGQPVETYLPELSESDWAGTPVIDIADMASGMSGLEADDPDAQTRRDSPYGLFEASLGIMPATTRTMSSTSEYIKTLPRLKPSGQVYEYSSVNTFVLCWLAEEVTGKPYADLVSEWIWQKLGAESDALMSISKVGAPGGHATMNTTLRDKGRYGLLFTPSFGVVVDGPRVVSDAAIQRIQTSGRPKIFDKGAAGRSCINVLPAGDVPHHNTYQWDCVWEDGDFYKGGYGGQGLYVSPARDLVIAWFSSGTAQEVADTMVYARAIATSGLFKA